ncbi:hypothetical protein [Anaerofustis stercorihominis]|uniref:hypothetical protein n=1 Tax=Anaerofustis stercorihominis TaxID=214853 RepID=UPI0039844109
MIDVTNDDIRRYIYEVIDDGIGSNLTCDEIKNALSLWNKGISIGKHNCTKAIIDSIGILLNKINKFKADNDYALNSITCSFKNGERIRYRAAEEETLEYDIDDIVTIYLEELLKNRRCNNENSNNGRES